MPSKRVTDQRDGKNRENPVKAGTDLRVLWEAKLRIGDQKDSFLFRATEEFDLAAFTAEALLQRSPASSMVGAVIVGIERKARLWN
jgi:hypothetical protein